MKETEVEPMLDKPLDGARARRAGGYVAAHAARALVAVALLSLLGAGPAQARLSDEELGGVIQLDPETAAADMANPWRSADPLAVPDQFGPGAVLSVGNIRMKILNLGVMGNPVTNTSTDPSAQWPGSSGVEYLFGIFLAVGAVNPFATDPNQIRRVSINREWRPPTLDKEDRIYRAFDGIINGQRFVNDDGDFNNLDPDQPPKVDEDFLDGRDNDDDGSIDEDHAALGQQEYSYVIRDDTKEAINSAFNEKHSPRGLEARVRCWAYSVAGFQDFNVAQYDIRNVSGHMLDSLYIGWGVDMDAGPVITGAWWVDDIDFPQYPYGEFVFKVGGGQGELPDVARRQYPHDPELDRFVSADSAMCPRDTIRINAFTTGDQDGDLGRTSGVGTFMLIDHTIDPLGVNAPKRVGFHSFRSYTGGTAYIGGGAPRVDQERYESMASGEHVDPVTGFIMADQGAARGDYAQWCSVGPFLNVQPNQVLTATVAFGIRPGSMALIGGYALDYQRYQNGTLSGGDLIASYPSLANAITVQIAFEGINETREGFIETKPENEGGRDGHGRETPIRLPRGSSPETVVEDCSGVGRETREIIVNDRDYSWFDFDCDFCTGVYDYVTRSGLFHKTWNASAPPPNPTTNLSTLYNFSDNPDRQFVASRDKAIRLAWDNISEVTPDPKSRWRDFRGFDIWKVSDWSRPVGASGPSESDWQLLGEYRAFDYYTANNPSGVPRERNYNRDAQGNKVCDSCYVFVPNYYDPNTGLYGKTLPIFLDRFDLWNKQNGEIIKPDYTVSCETDTAGARMPLEINSGDMEFEGGSYEHRFENAGTYPFICLRHPKEMYNVIVSDAATVDSALILISGPPTRFEPAEAFIKPKGRVRWANASPANHAIQSNRNCRRVNGVIVHRTEKDRAENQEERIRFVVGRYSYLDREVKNGFLYFYSVTALDSTNEGGTTTEFSGRRSAVESEGIVPEAAVDANGAQGVWVVPNPYRGYARIPERPSTWDLTPNATDPTGTHIDFMGLPRGRWTIRIYTVAGDLVQELHSTDPVNESIRQPVLIGNDSYAGYNRQQDNPNDGQARWNLISRNGQDIVSGIYIFTVESDEGSQRGKFVVIR